MSWNREAAIHTSDSHIRFHAGSHSIHRYARYTREAIEVGGVRLDNVPDTSSVSSLGSRWKSAVKRADIRRRNPYHTRHTYACWMLTAGANPSFIANQVA